MTWHQLHKRATPHERREIAILLLRRVMARADRDPPLLLIRFVDYVETPSKARFILPLLAAQGLSIVIGLGLASGLGLLIMLAVNVALVGVVALHKSARSTPQLAN